jgi:C-terminal processing protease CtpA/Prc
MWPMLAAVAPLLPRGRLGVFVDARGRAQPWTLGRHWVRLGRSLQARSPHPSARNLATPLAVLTGPRTASSGEALAVALRGRPCTRSFGAPTCGLTSANTTHRLPDGSRLYLTVAWFADRQGSRFTGPLTPDHPVDEPARDGSPDPVLRRALRWAADHDDGSGPVS